MEAGVCIRTCCRIITARKSTIISTRSGRSSQRRTIFRSSRISSSRWATPRVRIFWLLCHCEECVQNISALMEMSSPAVSHHLRGLKDNGLIVSRRVGKEVFYKAADTDQSRLLHIMIEKVMAISCPET